MRDTPLAAITVPDSSDVADVPTHIYNAITESEKYFNLVFASAAVRDAAFTAAGVTPSDGLKCYLTDTDTQQTYLNGSWTSQEPTVICTSGTRPGSPTHVGMRIYETDTKVDRVWDGSSWLIPGQRLAATPVSINADTAIVGATADINLAVVTFTAISTHYYQYDLYLPRLVQSSAAGEATILCSDNSNVEKGVGGRWFNYMSLAGATASCNMKVLETGISGSITRKFRGATTGGNFTMAGASYPGSLRVIDLGPAT